MVTLKSVFTRHEKGNATGALFCEAITSCRPVEFYYHGGFRLAEPYGIGVWLPSDRVDNEILICYQSGGYVGLGEPLGWKMFRLREIHEAKIILEGFQVRPEYRSFTENLASIRCCVTAPGKESGAGAAAPARIKEPSLSHNEMMRRFRSGHPLVRFARKAAGIGCAILKRGA
jgi:hypothetical protein